MLFRGFSPLFLVTIADPGSLKKVTVVIHLTVVAVSTLPENVANDERSIYIAPAIFWETIGSCSHSCLRIDKLCLKKQRVILFFNQILATMWRIPTTRSAPTGIATLANVCSAPSESFTIGEKEKLEFVFSNNDLFLPPFFTQTTILPVIQD